MMKMTLNRARFMSPAPATSAPQITRAAIPAVPAHLSRYAHVGTTCEDSAWIIRVDERYESDPGFLTWLDDLRHDRVTVRVEPVSVEELVSHLVPQGSELDRETDLRIRQKLIEFLRLSDAVGASDVHWLLGRHTLETQLRIDGDLYTAARFSENATDGQQLLRCVYYGLAQNKESEYIAVDFQKMQIEGARIEASALDNIRLIRGPAHPIEQGGEFAVGRLQAHEDYEGRRIISAADASDRLGLRQPYRPSELRAIARGLPVESSGAPRIEALKALAGFDEGQIEILERILNHPKGLILTTGPTGSGKSTVMHGFMSYQAELMPTLRFITIEDPPEKPVAWGITLPVTERYGFLQLQQFTLRMDPDVIAVGELTGFDEADVAIRAAQTGHLVLGTLHTDTPYEVFERLQFLDFTRLAPAVTCNSRLIVGLVGTRLLPRLCPECKIPLASAGADALPAYMRTALLTWGSLDKVCVRGRGCPSCHGKGVGKRFLVSEVVETDTTLMRDIRERPLEVAMHEHRAQEGSDRTMLDRAIEHVLSGEVDPHAVQRALPITRREVEYGTGRNR